jgi:hypothetical protein
MDRLEGSDIVAHQALALARRDPGQSIHVGYGDKPSSYLTRQLSKTVLAFNGYAAVLDAQVLMELRYIRRRRLDAMDPRSRRLSVRSPATAGERAAFRRDQLLRRRPLFNADFRRTFLDHHRLVESTDHRDIWACTRSGDRAGQ